MALDLRQKQIEALVTMLCFNQQGQQKQLASGDEEDYKVLVLDPSCRDIISPLLKVNDLRKHGITLHLMIDADRQAVPDVPAIYFLAPTSDNIKKLVRDAGKQLYDTFHVNFSSPLPRPLLEDFASETVKAECVERVAKVHDQYLGFIALEKSVFTLQETQSYLRLNDPTAKDKDVEAAVSQMVSGLFSVLVTMGVIPIIRCPKGGAAEMVASQLDKRLRDQLVSRNNLFTEGGAASFQRPLLCLFDRNFELAVAVQHVWTYQPLLHDVLGFHLNKVTVKTADTPAVPNATKAYTLETDDSFWMANHTHEFPKVAEEVEGALAKYKQDVEEVNRKTDLGQDSESDALLDNTQNLVSAVNSLPELTERKRMIDKHTNIATALLNQIKSRTLDAFYQMEEEMLTTRTDKAAVLQMINDPSKGNPQDKLRLAIVYLLAAETTPPTETLEAIESALQSAGADTTAFAYVKRMRSLNLTEVGSGATAAGAGATQGNLVDWADKLYNQGINAVTKGVKNLLSGGHQLAVTRVVEALMENKVEVESYATFDPKAAPGAASASVAGGGSGATAGAGGGAGASAFRSAIVFMIGGGNYLENQSLQEMANRNPQATKSIVYGATEMLTGSEFIDQLKMLGEKMAKK